MLSKGEAGIQEIHLSKQMRKCHIDVYAFKGGGRNTRNPLSKQMRKCHIDVYASTKEAGKGEAYRCLCFNEGGRNTRNPLSSQMRKCHIDVYAFKGGGRNTRKSFVETNEKVSYRFFLICFDKGIPVFLPPPLKA